jgi:sugar/nucleoside kinase (ribokinase family)
LDSFAGQVVDAVGSGDALLAYAALALASNGNTVIASVLGALAAAAECEFDGNIPVKPDDVGNKLERVERDIHYR